MSTIAYRRSEDGRQRLADHLEPLALGGHALGPLRGLCRSCNGRRGAKPYSWKD